MVRAVGLQAEARRVTPGVRLIWDVGAQLGEGPAWFADEAALRFVDIKRGKLHRYDPASGARETLDVGGMPSFIVPETGGGILVGSQHHLWQLQGSSLSIPVATIDQPTHNRTNDATVDALGRLWFGTMDDEEQRPTGALYCLDRGRLHRTGGEAIVTNGPAVSVDARSLYHVDSGNRTIWHHPIKDGPMLGKGEIFVQLRPADGYPDGVTLDSEDCLWVALWDGWAVQRYAPDGRLLQTVSIPCARPTKIAFGGDDFRTAYVTTARVGIDHAALAAQPLAGGLFAFDPPVAGRRLPAAR